MGTSHALVIPYPAQGHILPLLEIARRLAAADFRVTFVNTEHHHRRLLAAGACRAACVSMFTVADGLSAGDDRADLGRVAVAYTSVVPDQVERLILREKGGEGEISCVIADQGLGWAFDLAKKMGFPAAAFWAASATTLATIMSIPRLIREGIILPDGRAGKEETFQLAAGMPVMTHGHLSWNRFTTDEERLLFFNLLRDKVRAIAAGDSLLFCNSFAAIEGPSLSYLPRLLSLGPLLSPQHFPPEHAATAAWLDAQAPGSVVYAAFGSSAVFTPQQIQELDLGLELSGKPFLWVSGGGSREIRRRRRARGKVVEWAPQQHVLMHPAVGCFISHCGWNSAVEGAANGVPFLCWPYFADQFLNCDFICDVWKTGIKLQAAGDGIVSAEEIREKLDKLLADKGIRERARKIREEAETAAQGGGESTENFGGFSLAMRENTGD